MIAIPFIYFIILFIYLKIKNKGTDVSAYLALLYAFISFFAIIVDVCGIYDTNGVCAKMPISIGATFSYCALLTLSIVPFSRMRSTELKTVTITKPQLMDFVSWGLILTFILTFFVLCSDIIVALQSDLQELRSAVYAGEEEVEVTGLKWLLLLPNTLFSQFSPIAILFFYINVTQSRKSTLFNYILLASSVTPILSAILIAGRTQIIYWLLSYLLCFFLFRNQMEAKQRKIVLTPFFVLAGVFVVFFASVTIARFASNTLDSDAKTFNSIAAYIGQPFINYNNFFNNYVCHQISFNRIFPALHYFVLDPDWTLDSYRELILSQTGMNIGIFYTFLGDWMVDLDKTGMIILVLLFAIVSTYISRQEDDNSIPIYRLLLIQLLILIPLQGIFYYSFHRVDVGYYIIGTLIISFFFKYTFKIR